MSMSSEQDPWMRGEPGFLELRIELMRMYRRARRRPIMTIFVALLAAAAVCAYRARKEPSVAASVTFRVSEVEKAGTQVTTPRPTKELKEYVSSVAFRSSNLIDLMNKHKINQHLIEDDPMVAVERFRDDIGVDVYRNYFVEEWQSNKSARLVVTYYAGSIEEATKLATDLGNLVVEEETRRRANTANAAAGDSRELVEFSRNEVAKREAEIVRLEAEIPQASGPDAALMRIQLEAVKRSLEPATDRFMKAQVRQANLELALVLELNNLGVRFDKVDDSIEIVTRKSTSASLGVLGAIVFVLTLPIAVMLVGAFDSRVYDLDDVNRLGLRGLGHIPPFRGDSVGSLEARARASGRV